LRLSGCAAQQALADYCISPAAVRRATKRHEAKRVQGAGFLIQHVGTEHLLLGLIAEDNEACRVLSELGATPDTIRSRLPAFFGMDADTEA
jgi:hypothetical protein